MHASRTSWRRGGPKPTRRQTKRSARECVPYARILSHFGDGEPCSAYLKRIKQVMRQT